ncbi:universal stress protein [Patulibacter sp. S7RM1-6]
MFRQPLLVLTESPAGRRALAFAVELATTDRSCLTIATVIDTSPPWWAGTGAALDAVQERRDGCRRHERLLAETRDALPPDLAVRTRCLQASERLGPQVLRALGEGGHDVLVLEAPAPWPAPAGHGSAWLQRHSPVPVLTVRAPDA